QIALSIVLLVGAGLLSVSFVRLQRVSPGFTADHALTARVLLPVGTSFDFKRDGPGWAATFERITTRLAALPNVVALGAVSALPLTGSVGGAAITTTGNPRPPPGQGPKAEYVIVSGDYFRAAGVKLVSGRAFATSDRADSPPVVIVSREFERRYFPGGHAVGQRIQG